MRNMQHKVNKKEESKLNCISKYWYSLLNEDIKGAKETLSSLSKNKREELELNNFKWIKKSLLDVGLNDFSLINITLDSYENKYFYTVLYDNKILFKEAVLFDNNDKIIFTGNFEFSDVVSKVSYSKEKKLSFAIKERFDQVLGISVNNNIFNIENSILNKGDFHCIHTDIIINECQSVDIKVFYKNKIEKRSIFVFSDKMDFFENPNLTIKGKDIFINKNIMSSQVPWSLIVFFEDNTSRYFTFPNKIKYSFNKNISKAIFTDAFDNDWELSQ